MQLFIDLEKDRPTVIPPPQSNYCIEIENVTPVASYNWVEAPGQGIAIEVPGCPPFWREPRLPVHIEPETGTKFIDQNGARSDTLRISPVSPLLTAIDACNPNFNFADIDLITDRICLQRLIQWLTGTGMTDREREFRIDVQLAGEKTMIFSRWENATTEDIPPNTFWGFGQNFVKAVTTQTNKNASGHNRIVSYNLGAMKCLVRFEVDACKQPAEVVAPAQNPHFTAPPGLQVIKSGYIVPQNLLLDMRTLPSKQTIDWNKHFPQLYLSGIPQLVVAKHYRDHIELLETFKSQSPNMASHVVLVQNALGQVELFLEQTLQFLKREENRGKEFSFVCIKGNLQRFNRRKGGGRSLSDEVLQRFG
ncbi:hypothetical protein BT69DRAFT_235006 [Atractiella rhizophila]|nr:hypothetical protein BT69DRAFT_235006 [Atractiella rhizophila]